MIKRIARYKDLLYIFIWRELLIRYKQAVIGVLWAVIQPLSLMVLFVIVFGIILNVSTKGYPKALFYFTGLVPWTFFSTSMNSSIMSLLSYRNLITKIYFPRELIIISRVAVFGIDYCVAFVLLFGMILFYNIKPSLTLLWVFPLSFLLFIVTYSLCLILAAVNVYFRDVKLASGFILKFWMFATPIFYSIQGVDMKIKVFLYLNPLTYIIENLRKVVLESQNINLWHYSIALGASLFLSYICTIVFLRLERSFADVI